MLVLIKSHFHKSKQVDNKRVELRDRADKCGFNGYLFKVRMVFKDLGTNEIGLVHYRHSKQGKSNCHCHTENDQTKWHPLQNMKDFELQTTTAITIVDEKYYVRS
jgi:hypothetical protein